MRRIRMAGKWAGVDKGFMAAWTKKVDKIE
jgi:hypothetical protein